MVAVAVAGRIDEHNLLCARNRLCVDVHAAGVGVALIDLVLRSVGVHRPQVVEGYLAAVHVFPAHVEDASVGQDPRRVVVFRICGQHPNAGAVGLHPVDRGHLRHPAVHPATAARGHEHDVSVRQPRGLEVVVLAERQLAEVGAVGVDRVEVVGARAAGTVREEDRPSVVVDARVAHAAGLVREQRTELPGLQVVREEPPFLAVDRGVGGLAVVRDVRVPVRIHAGRARGEHHFVEGTVRAGKELAAHCRLRPLDRTN